MNKRLFWPALATVSFMCITASISAHDLWLNADNHNPSPGEKTNIKVVFGHNFPYYDILIKRDALAEFCYFSPDGQKKEISKTWEDKQWKEKEHWQGNFPLSRKEPMLSARIRRFLRESPFQPIFTPRMQVIILKMNLFPVLAKSNENGDADIRITQPGIWMIAGNHKVDFSASLTFEIK